MIGWGVVLCVVGGFLLYSASGDGGKRPSAVHDPKGYKDALDFESLISSKKSWGVVLLIIGAILLFSKSK